MRTMKSLLASCALATVAACGSGGHTVTMSIAVPTSAANALTAAVTSTASADGLSLSDGTNTLVISTAEVVLKEIELKGSDVTECHPAGGSMLSSSALTSSDGTDATGTQDATDGTAGGQDTHDQCEKFSTGPRLVTLPLDGSVSQQLAVDVPPGTYDRVEFEIRKLDASNGSDILRDRPDLVDVSVHLVGTFNGEPFVFVTSESFEQKVAIAPPLVVDGSTTSVNVTLSIDLAAWVTGADGSLVNPATAASVVQASIDGGFECFEDHNEDGHQDGDHSGSGSGA